MLVGWLLLIILRGAANLTVETTKFNLTYSLTPGYHEALDKIFPIPASVGYTLACRALL
jgi:hypothetical protein